MVPERVRGVRIEGGRPLRDAAHLPPLSDRDAVTAWQAWRGDDGPLYVRFEDSVRDGHMPLHGLQRLARTGEVWADAGPRSADDAMDLAFSGATRVVVWWDDMPGRELDDLLDGMEEGLLLGIRPGDAAALDDALSVAREHRLAVLVDGPATPVLSAVDAGELDVLLLGPTGSLGRLRASTDEEE